MKILQNIKSYTVRAIQKLFNTRKPAYQEVIDRANALVESIDGKYKLVSMSSSYPGKTLSFYDLSLANDGEAEDNDDFDGVYGEDTDSTDKKEKKYDDSDTDDPLEEGTEAKEVEEKAENFEAGVTIINIGDRKRTNYTGATLIDDEYTPPDLKELYKNTTEYNDIHDCLLEVNQLIETYEIKVREQVIDSKTIYENYESDFRKIENVKNVELNDDRIEFFLESYDITNETQLKIRDILKKDIRELKTGFRKGTPLLMKVKGERTINPVLNKTLEQLREQSEELEKAANKVKKALKDMATKETVPKDVDKVAKQALSHLRKNIGEDNKLSRTMVVTAVGPKNIGGSTFSFTTYIRIQNDSGLDVFVAVTSFLKKLESRYNLVTHATVLDSYKKPGDFNPGNVVFGKTGIKNFSKMYTEIDKQLNIKGVKFGLTAMPLNVQGAKLNAMMKTVEGVVSSRIFGRVAVILIDKSYPDTAIVKDILPEAIIILRSLLPKNYRQLDFTNYKIETTRKSKMLLMVVSK